MSYLDGLLDVPILSSGAAVGGVGGKSGAGLNFIGVTASYNQASGNIDVGFSGTPITAVVGSGAITATTVGTTTTVGSNATASPTASTIALRDGSGGVVGAYFATAASNVASTGSLKCIAGAQDIVCIKGATHATVPILSVDQSGVEVSIGAGVEINAISFNNAVLNKANIISFGPANSFTIGQTQATGTGANAGNDATIQAQQGQNVASGTNNSGGNLFLGGGLVGTGGSGGAAGLLQFITPTLAQSYVDYAPIAAPATPGTNTSRLYSDTSTGHLSSKGSSGTVTDLIAAAALATAAVPNTRTATATSPLTGGGALSANIVFAIQASSPSQAGSMSAAQATQLAALPATLAGGFFALSVTLSAGTKTQASGKNLSSAIIVAVLLGTPTTAVGNVTATISGNNVIVTSYTAGAVTAITDASTYIVMIVGAV